MNPRSCDSPSSAADLFTVVIGYEDYACGIRAMELYRRLCARWHGSLNFRSVLWKFEPLGVPSLLVDATRDAVQADLILISVNGDRLLPAEALTWIGRWRKQTRREPALALLFDARHQHSESAQRIEAFLRDVATSAQLRLFSSAEGRPSPFATGADSEPRSESEETKLLRTALHPQDCLDHWGIND